MKICDTKTFMYYTYFYVDGYYITSSPCVSKGLNSKFLLILLSNCDILTKETFMYANLHISESWMSVD